MLPAWRPFPLKALCLPEAIQPHTHSRDQIRRAIQSARRLVPMLVLSRKESERIRLGNSIVLTIVRVAGDKVRLGIEAPPDLIVLRDELQAHDQTAPVPAESEL